MFPRNSSPRKSSYFILYIPHGSDGTDIERWEPRVRVNFISHTVQMEQGVVKYYKLWIFYLYIPHGSDGTLQFDLLPSDFNILYIPHGSDGTHHQGEQARLGSALYIPHGSDGTR